MSDPTDTGEQWLIKEDGDGTAAALAANVEQRKWRVLIVDDDADVHSVTRLALRGLRYKGRELELFSAYSGQEGYALLRDTHDIALVLLDVVMETDDAGLVLAARIRGELDNQVVRVVLRTGQPGQAPEQNVIVEYDINDYKSKTELTTQKMFTTVVAALRAYESLRVLQRSRTGLGKILSATNNLYHARSLREFASGVLSQVSAILDVGADGLLCVLQVGQSVPTVVAATGDYAVLADNGEIPLGHPLQASIEKTFKARRSQFDHPANVLFVPTQVKRELAIAVTPPWPLAQFQRDLLELFGQRIAAAFDNLYVFDQLLKTQEATVVALADLAEFRDTGTGGHVRRCRALATGIAQTMRARGIVEEELTHELIDMIGLASVLHDVGKVATPDHILLKPGVHTPQERDVMQTHAQAGRDILERAAKMVAGVSYLSYGAQIAGAHHEHFDGAGYPAGSKGGAIPLAARIMAVVDVFDALLHRRPYKRAWAYEDVVVYIKERRGTQFDPNVVDALLEIIERDPPVVEPDED
jgi:response regulator RpfG family c-di-GMP phosphodiesterase